MQIQECRGVYGEPIAVTLPITPESARTAKRCDMLHGKFRETTGDAYDIYCKW